MKLVTLLSTQKNEFDVVKRLNIHTDCIVVNQCGIDMFTPIVKDAQLISWIDSRTKGLSKSRNLAVKAANADLCLLSDDDVVFVDGISEQIVDAFYRNEDADILAFIVDGFGRKKKRWGSTRRINYFESMKISSVQIAFRLKSVRKVGVEFKEEFGAGSKYYVGEENIWLWDCLRAGLRIRFIPITIATLSESKSSWFEGYTDWYFVSKGAAFTAMSQPLSIFLIFQFAVRKNKMWRGGMSFQNAIRGMLKGRAMYLASLHSK